MEDLVFAEFYATEHDVGIDSVTVKQKLEEKIEPKAGSSEFILVDRDSTVSWRRIVFRLLWAVTTGHAATYAGSGVGAAHFSSSLRQACDRAKTIIPHRYRWPWCYRESSSLHPRALPTLCFQGPDAGMWSPITFALLVEARDSPIQGHLLIHEYTLIQVQYL
eukprot:5697017-Amphidinium_carterae.2